MADEPLIPLEDIALCSGVDVPEFKATCRVPLFPNEWNCWQLWVNDERATSWEAVEDLIHDALRVWFEYGIVAPFNSIPIHDVRLSREPYGNADGSQVQRAVRKEDCPLGTTVAGRAPLRVFLRFVYRGQLTNLPFPTFKGSLLVGYSWCPTAADVMVDNVYLPLTDAIPEEPEWYEPIVPDVPDIDIDIPDFADPRKTWTGALGWTLAGVGAIVAGYLLLRK